MKTAKDTLNKIRSELEELIQYNNAPGIRTALDVVEKYIPVKITIEIDSTLHNRIIKTKAKDQSLKDWVIDALRLKLDEEE